MYVSGPKNLPGNALTKYNQWHPSDEKEIDRRIQSAACNHPTTSPHCNQIAYNGGSMARVKPRSGADRR